MEDFTLRVALGPLWPLFQDPEVLEILVDAPDQVYFSGRSEQLRTSRVRFGSRGELLEVARQLVALSGRSPDSLRGAVDMRLPGGARMTALLPPLFHSAAALRIRKDCRRALTWDQLVIDGGLDVAGRRALEGVLTGDRGVLVAGAPGGGRTNLAGLLADSYPPEERVAVVEPSQELQLLRDRCLRLETSPRVGMGELVHMAAALRPDRLVVNELCEGVACASLEAFGDGQSGLLVLGAESGEDALVRLERQALAEMPGFPEGQLRARISGAFDHLVFCRQEADGSRRVSEVSVIEPWSGGGLRLRSLIGRPRPGAGRLAVA